MSSIHFYLFIFHFSAKQLHLTHHSKTTKKKLIKVKWIITYERATQNNIIQKSN